ncbi:MAG: DegV family protein [Chloroflexi bacterium]|nr:DegV family protein [Chloroflexota bacterium]
MALHIVMDSVGDMPEAWKEQYQIHVIPINLHLGDQVVPDDGQSITREDFFRWIEEHQQIPRTSQPSPGQFKAFYERIAQPGDTILSIHVTSKLSGTFQSATLAARELQDRFHIVPFDSKGGSLMMGFLARAAAIARERGWSLDRMLAHLETMRERIGIALTLSNLEFARLGGRISGPQSFFASMLRIHPIIELRDGMLPIVDKVRTRKRATRWLLDWLQKRYGDTPLHLGVMHARASDWARELAQRVQERFHVVELIQGPISLALTVHLGPDAVGLVACPADVALT